jgi:hypothetical protein
MLRDAALTYAARKWRVIPLHEMRGQSCTCHFGAACRTPAKHPRIKAWEKAASTDVTQITQWWHRYPTANVGIVTGADSGIVVIDTDPRHGGAINLDELQRMYAALPETPQVLTGGGGTHDYFACTEVLPSCDLAHGIQFQTENHLVVAPPSLHASGKLYAWEASLEPEDIPLAPLPAWVRALALTHYQEDTEGTVVDLEHLPAITLQDLRVSARIKAVIQTGEDPENPRRYPSRSEALFAVIHALIGGGHDDTTIAAVVLNRAWRISEKPWGQRDPGSPRYEASIRQWVGKELLRARAKHQPGMNGHVPTSSPFFASRDPAGSNAAPFPLTLPAQTLPLYPPLPQAARVPALPVAEVAPWLAAYCHYSQQWSPRAAQGFHEAIGLWILSTIAARRLCVEMGSPIYPVLFLALVARSTLYAKTTTAKLGRDLIIRAGCQHLLASDRSTPQALLRSMSGRVALDYGSRSEEDQAAVRNRLAFAAQRGWYFEEWGGLLQQMTRRDSPMAEFHGLLRVLDDGYESFSSETIQRGLEYVKSPYLALLASATPHDLTFFMKPGSPWWHDGFWPRFALIVPTEEDIPRMTRRPSGAARPPGALVEPLHSWHTRLGIPSVHVEPLSDAKGKLTGEWTAASTPLPCHALGMADDVLEAYHRYNESLLQLVINGDAATDLEASYGRLHDKALRISMLLTSFAGEETITLPIWAYAQEVTERWRVMLHTVIATIAGSQPLTREEELEQKIEHLLATEGPKTGRELQQRLHVASRDCALLLASMVKLERLVLWQQGKATYYGLPIDAPQEEREQNEEKPESATRRQV